MPKKYNTDLFSFSIYKALMSEELWIFLPLAIAQVAVSKYCSCGSKTTQGTERQSQTQPTVTRKQAQSGILFWHKQEQSLAQVISIFSVSHW